MPLVEPLTRNQAAVGAPGLGGQSSASADQAGRLARVFDAAGHGDVDREQRVAEDLAHARPAPPCRACGPGVWKGVIAGGAVAQQGVEVRGLRLVGRLLRSSPCRRRARSAPPCVTRPASISGGVIDSTSLQAERAITRRVSHKPRPDSESTLRAEPHRHAAHRLGAHRALQLPLRPPPRRQLRRCASRTPTRRAPRSATSEPSSTTCAWLGPRLGRGPRRGGPFGPYRQSERAASATAPRPTSCSPAGLAYPCFCPQERLEELRARGAGRRPHAALRPPLPGARRRRGRAPAGAPASRRRCASRVPAGDVIFDDLIRGPVVFGADAIGDFIILRSDGVAGYNFAAVVDDRDMAHHPRHPRRRPPHQHRPPGAAASRALGARRRRATRTTP